MSVIKHLKNNPDVLTPKCLACDDVRESAEKKNGGFCTTKGTRKNTDLVLIENKSLPHL